ncbi:hypothetical protein [Pseudanabaena sp. PCC 6802]|nr:hypothetical protein [Pseudanabaena sp. PCC 6802]
MEIKLKKHLSLFVHRSTIAFLVVFGIGKREISPTVTQLDN